MMYGINIVNDNIQGLGKAHDTGLRRRKGGLRMSIPRRESIGLADPRGCDDNEGE